MLSGGKCLEIQTARKRKRCVVSMAKYMAVFGQRSGEKAHEGEKEKASGDHPALPDWLIFPFCAERENARNERSYMKRTWGVCQKNLFGATHCNLAPAPSMASCSAVPKDARAGNGWTSISSATKSLRI